MSIQWPPYSGAQIIMGAEDNSFVKGLEGDGVVTGLTLSAAGVDMDVDVASGTAYVNGVLQNNVGGSVTLSNGDATNPRFDLVWINSSNTLGKTEGTPAANPVFPDYPANVVILGVAYVQATVTTISTSDLRYRARVEIPNYYKLGTDLPVDTDKRIHSGTYGRPFRKFDPACLASMNTGWEYYDRGMVRLPASTSGRLETPCPIRNYAGNSSNQSRIGTIVVHLQFSGGAPTKLDMNLCRMDLSEGAGEGTVTVVQTVSTYTTISGTKHKQTMTANHDMVTGNAYFIQLDYTAASYYIVYSGIYWEGYEEL